MASHELSTGLYNLIMAIKNNFPSLSEDEASKLAEILLNEISKRINNGEQIAFLRYRSSGEPELSMFALRILEEKR